MQNCSPWIDFLRSGLRSQRLIQAAAQFGRVLMKMRADPLAGCEAGGARPSCKRLRPGDECPATRTKGVRACVVLCSKCRYYTLTQWTDKYSLGCRPSRGTVQVDLGGLVMEGNGASWLSWSANDWEGKGHNGFNEANTLKWDSQLLCFAGALIHTTAYSKALGAGLHVDVLNVSKGGEAGGYLTLSSPHHETTTPTAELLW